MLTVNGGMLTEHGGMLTVQGGMLTGHGGMLTVQGGMLTVHGGMLTEHGGMLTVQGGMHSDGRRRQGWHTSLQSRFQPVLLARGSRREQDVASITCISYMRVHRPLHLSL